MRIVADTNVFLCVALAQPERSRIISLTQGHELIAPSILPFEIGNALSALARRNSLTAELVRDAWKVTQSIPVQLRDTQVLPALDIAMQHKIYAYDAYFLECALAARSPLLTLDKGMRRVARELNIHVWE